MIVRYISNGRQVRLEERDQSTLLFDVLKLAFGALGTETNQIVWAHVFPNMVETAYFEPIDSFEFPSCLSIEGIFAQSTAASLVIGTIEGVRWVDMLVNAIIKWTHICIDLRTSWSFVWILFMKIWTLVIFLSAITSEPKFANFSLNPGRCGAAIYR